MFLTNITIINRIFDPLEQFEVVPFINLWGLPSITNLVLTFFFALCFFSFLLAGFNYKSFTNYDFLLITAYNLVKSIVDDNLYIKKQIYFPVLFFLFFVILLCNLIGLTPYAFTVTSSFVFTFYLALTHFTGINLIVLYQSKWGSTNLFLPQGAPFVITPFLIIIEFVSYVARVFSLSIRLFANMMSGHALLKILIGFSWVLFTSGSLLAVLGIFPWLIVTIITFLELLIAFLQAYVFVILITIYIHDNLNLH